MKPPQLWARAVRPGGLMPRAAGGVPHQPWVYGLSEESETVTYLFKNDQAASASDSNLLAHVDGIRDGIAVVPAFFGFIHDCFQTRGAIADTLLWSWSCSLLNAAAMPRTSSEPPTSKYPAMNPKKNSDSTLFIRSRRRRTDLLQAQIRQEVHFRDRLLAYACFRCKANAANGLLRLLSQSPKNRHSRLPVCKRMFTPPGNCVFICSHRIVRKTQPRVERVNPIPTVED
jgi:hypothetical protein